MKTLDKLAIFSNFMKMGNKMYNIIYILFNLLYALEVFLSILKSIKNDFYNCCFKLFILLIFFLYKMRWSHIYPM